MSQQGLDKVCPSCGAVAQASERFCRSCGTALANDPDSLNDADSDDTPTQPITIPMHAMAPGDPLPPPDPAFDPDEFDRMFDTDRFRVVEQTTPTMQSIGLAWDPDAIPDVPGPITAEVPIVGISLRVRMTLVVLASLTAVVAVMACVFNVASYHVTGDVTAALTAQANGFTSNALVASIIAAVLLLVGAVSGMRGDRFGMGLVGGVGLAVSGLMAWVVGQAVSLIDTAKQAMTVHGGNYQLVTKLDVGWWLAVAAAVLGGAVFAVAVAGARDPGGRRVHPAVGALGVLGTICVVLGSMLPAHTGTLADNFSSLHPVGATRFPKAKVLLTFGVFHEPVPPITTYLRLLLLLLLLVGGVVGFLIATRWGLGLVLGSMCIALWQWITAVTKSGDLPFGIAGGNPGSNGVTPHFLTNIGIVVVLVAMLVYVAFLVQRRAAS